MLKSRALKRRALTTAIAALLLSVCVLPAEATPITGGFSIFGNYLPVNGQTGVGAALGSATGIDFTNLFSTTPSPGTAGQFFVASVSGSFSVIAPGSVGTIQDFSFAGLGSLAFPNPTISGPLVSFQNVGGATFTLTSFGPISQSANQLTVNGLGYFTLAGFTQTAGTFILTANAAANTFSFSASNASVPEPASLLLLGTGLIITSAALRRRTRRKS